MTWTTRLVCLMGVLFARGVAFAADGQPTNDLVRARAEALVGKKAVLGLAVGVVEGDKTTVVFVGQRAAGGPPPDENTLFEIGSVSKTFTALLLADAVARGEVKLDEPLSELLGPTVSVPKFEQQPIRLVDLATQTSGLPRLPTNLRIVNPFNPYAWYQLDDLTEFLAEYKLTRAPGAQYEYSNVGMGLLGHALATRARKSYVELLVERVCRPLRLNDTVIDLSKAQDERMASGISVLGLPAMRWDLPALAGAGGIRSTMHDMLIVVRANLAPDQTPLASAIRLTHEPRFLVTEPDETNSAKIEIGLAWHITTSGGNRIIWHNGMTGGYAAHVALIPAKKTGLIVLSNTASFEVDKLAGEVLQELLERK